VNERQFFLDWLRIAAFGILVPYHTFMYYVTWTYHVKSPFASKDLEPFMVLSSPWRMSLLFLISGAATAFMLKRGASGSLLKQRSGRLLLPLIVGIFLIVPPQSYFEVVYRFNYQGSFWDFLQLYYQRYKGFCDAQGCLRLPTWNHLWFIPYLWCYTVVLWVLVRLWPQGLSRVSSLFFGRLNGLALFLVPIALLFIIRLLLYPRFPRTYDVVNDWFSHGQYFFVFLLGALCANYQPVWEQFVRWRWVGLGGWIVAWLVFLFTYGKIPPWGEMLVLVCLMWCALVAFLGFGRLLLERDHPWRKTLTEAVFPFYIFHQTWIFVLTQWLLPLRWNPFGDNYLVRFGGDTVSLVFTGVHSARSSDQPSPRGDLHETSRSRIDARSGSGQEWIVGAFGPSYRERRTHAPR
jgi:glucans biosynthesis protein C